MWEFKAKIKIRTDSRTVLGQLKQITSTGGLGSSWRTGHLVVRGAQLRDWIVGRSFLASCLKRAEQPANGPTNILPGPAVAQARARMGLGIPAAK